MVTIEIFMLQTFFRPAVENVRNNLGQSSVSEEHIREVCRTMLEEAKQMYCGPLSRGSSPFSDCEATSLIDCRLRRTHTQVCYIMKFNHWIEFLCTTYIICVDVILS